MNDLSCCNINCQKLIHSPILSANILIKYHFFLVRLDTTEERDCGRLYNISSENEVRLMATGRLQSGTCAVTLRIDSHDDLLCETVCIKMSVSQLQTCDVKMLFVPVTFDKSKVVDPKV